MSDATKLARLTSARHRITGSSGCVYDATVHESGRVTLRRAPERVSARSIAAEAWEVATRLPNERKPYRPRKQGHASQHGPQMIVTGTKAAIVAPYGPRRIDSELNASRTRAAIAMRVVRAAEGR